MRPGRCHPGNDETPPAWGVRQSRRFNEAGALPPRKSPDKAPVSSYKTLLQ